MDKQREAFQQELLTVWRSLDLDRLFTIDESGKYEDMGTRAAYHFWQAGTKQAAKKISVIECANKNLYQLNDDFEKQIESLQAEAKFDNCTIEFLRKETIEQQSEIEQLKSHIDYIFEESKHIKTIPDSREHQLFEIVCHWHEEIHEPTA